MSLFIAVLGLLGGFATPALLSDRREPAGPALRLLCCLSTVGLAWVADRRAAGRS
jgi:uncharacterized membrane protein